MSSAPILPFRFIQRSAKSSWTGAHVATTEETHGLIRLEETRLVIQMTVARKIMDCSAMGSVETRYENLPVEEHALDLAEIGSVSLRVPTWNFWSAPRVVFHVKEMRAIEGLPSVGPAEFSVPVAYRDRAAANAFVVQCHLALSQVLPPVPQRAKPLPNP